MHIIKRMEMLIESLPIKDQLLGKEFLNKRDFDSLSSLVDSAIYKVRHAHSKRQSMDKYIDIDIIKLETLKAEIDSYMLSLILSEY